MFITMTWPWKSPRRKFLSLMPLIERSQLLSGRRIISVSRGADRISGTGLTGGWTGAGAVVVAGVLIRLPD
jgi:hypothetical protein